MNITIWLDDPIMNAGFIVSAILFVFLGFIFLSYLFSFFKNKNSNEEFDTLPKISIVIPAHNEEKNILVCLKSIERSNYDKNLMEVLVIDDASKDNTASLAKAYAQRSRMSVSVFTIKHSGKSEALNFGIRKSNSELVVTVDADAILDLMALQELILPMADERVGASNAVSAIHEPKGLIENFQSIEYALNSLIRVSFSKNFRNSIWFMGVVACYRKSALRKIGYMKTDTLTEDMDVSLELYNANYNIVTASKAKIYTKACSLGELFKQRMRWYYGALQSLAKNKTSIKKKSPAVTFLYINQYWWTFFSIVFFPMTAYQVYYWLPQTGIVDTALYIFRWFSLWGPAYVIYKIPAWGINFASIFGVTAGIITLILSIGAIIEYKPKFGLWMLPALFFYFPYTIIINATIVASLFRYGFSRKKYFID